MSTTNNKSDKNNENPTNKQGTKRKFKSNFDASDYYEFNLTTMRNTKGGFLPPDENQTNILEKNKPTFVDDQLPFNLDPDSQLHCRECQSLDVDPLFLQIYDIKVCKQCKEDYPEKYSLLTKTEVKEDYLLTESELADRDLFKIWSKPNPRKSTWNNMQLFIREQVEEFAFKKWGGPEGLDQEFDRRDKEKAERKEKKYKAKVSDLRKRTRVATWKETTEKSKVHEHDFENLEEKSESGESQKKCTICGLIIEYEEF